MNLQTVFGRHWSTRIAVVFCGILFLTAGTATQLRHWGGTVPASHDPGQPVIVKFRVPLNPALHKKVAAYGGEMYRELSLINSAAYRISKRGLTELLKSNLVETVSPDRNEIKATLDYTAAAANKPVSGVNSTYTGKGVTAAIVDSGISWHPDLNSASGTSRVTRTEIFRSEITGEDLSLIHI